jgi:seryl-tRNA synthetase
MEHLARLQHKIDALQKEKDAINENLGIPHAGSYEQRRVWRKRRKQVSAGLREFKKQMNALTEALLKSSSSLTNF